MDDASPGADRQNSATYSHHLVYYTADTIGNQIRRAAISGQLLDLRLRTSTERTITANELRETIIDLAYSDTVRPDPRGLQVAGLIVDGDLDLNWCTIGTPLKFESCTFARIGMEGATVRALSLSACSVNSLRLVGVEIASDVVLDEGFECAGQVRAFGARIAGDLAMSGANLTHTGTGNDAALALDGAEISGGVFLTDGFECAGQVRLTGARIAGQLAMSGAKLTHTGTGNDAALALDGAEITGSVFLTDGFECAGAVTAIGTQISGYLHDDIACWPSVVDLDGCTYRIAIRGDLDKGRWAPDQRVEWLSKMTYSRSAYRHLAGQYWAHGYPDAAESVLIAMHAHQRRHYGRASGAVNWLSHHLVGYGYRPLNLVVATVVVVVIASWALWLVDPIRDRLVTAEAVDGYVYTVSGDAIDITIRTGTPPPPPPRPVRAGCGPSPGVCFSPTLYALDVFVPFADLQQRDAWRADTSDTGGQLLRLALTLAGLVGWVFTAAATVVVGRYVQNSER
jgi:hypothetical protein